MRADELMAMPAAEVDALSNRLLREVVDQSLWLVDSDQCSAMCVLACDPEPCVCRCGGSYHGLIRQA